MKTVAVRFLFVLIFAFSPCFAFSETSPETGEKKVICFSMIPKKNVDQQISELTPLIQLLEEKLGRPVKIIRPQSYHAVIEGILSETIDLAILGPASYAKARARDSRVDAFASFSREKGTITPQGSYYYSVLFTLKDRGFQSAQDLEGKKIALTDPESTSGSIIPNLIFSDDLCRSLKDFFGTIIYTGSHDRSIKAVIEGHVDAAFVASARIDESVQKGELTPGQISVLWRSQPIHYDPFVFSGGVGSSLRDQIRQIMLSPQPRLKPMFKQMQMAGIVAVTDEDYRPIHEIVARQALK